VRPPERPGVISTQAPQQRYPRPASQRERPRHPVAAEKPADKSDCAGIVVTVCRTETMTGQTIVIDSGHYFH
jgi:hypothetical protein